LFLSCVSSVEEPDPIWPNSVSPGIKFTEILKNLLRPLYGRRSLEVRVIVII
jgi:hypothetical protein